MKRLLSISLFLIGIIVIGCGQEKERILFNLEKYHNPKTLLTHQDSAIAFINYLQRNEIEKARKLFPKMFEIDVSVGIIKMEGEEPFLVGVGEYVNDYSNNSYDLLALTVYLKKQYNTKIDFYDKMIRGSIRLDTTNIAAMYLLSEIRYKHGLATDAAYLINKMKKLDNNNQEVNRIYSLTKDIKIDKSLPKSLYEFAKLDVIYVDLVE
jgi:hypothetical protein